MAITLTQFRTYLDAVNTAIDASDWSTAHQKLAQASVTLAGLAETLSDESMTRTLKKSLDDARTALSAAESANGSYDQHSRVGYLKFGYGR